MVLLQRREFIRDEATFQNGAAPLHGRPMAAVPTLSDFESSGLRSEVYWLKQEARSREPETQFYGFCVGRISTSLTNDRGACVTNIATA
jgi:hypothetical protein